MITSLPPKPPTSKNQLRSGALQGGSALSPQGSLFRHLPRRTPGRRGPHGCGEVLVAAGAAADRGAADGVAAALGWGGEGEEGGEGGGVIRVLVGGLLGKKCLVSFSLVSEVPGGLEGSLRFI